LLNANVSNEEGSGSMKYHVVARSAAGGMGPSLARHHVRTSYSVLFFPSSAIGAIREDAEIREDFAALAKSENDPRCSLCLLQSSPGKTK
jgi:hypothetical protein